VANKNKLEFDDPMRNHVISAQLRDEGHKLLNDPTKHRCEMQFTD